MGRGSGRGPSRRAALLAGGCAAAAALLVRPGRAAAAAGPREAVLYRDPSCGCCAGHARHLQASGYRVEVRDAADLAAVRAAHGVPERLAGCHTILLGDGLVVEGHVPAPLIDRLLAERPPGVVGLALPGMPAGVPGMPGERPDPLPVFAFDAAGNDTVFASI